MRTLLYNMINKLFLKKICTLAEDGLVKISSGPDMSESISSCSCNDADSLRLHSVLAEAVYNTKTHTRDDY